MGKVFENIKKFVLGSTVIGAVIYVADKIGMSTFGDYLIANNPILQTASADNVFGLHCMAMVFFLLTMVWVAGIIFVVCAVSVHIGGIIVDAIEGKKYGD